MTKQIFQILKPNEFHLPQQFQHNVKPERNNSSQNDEYQLVMRDLLNLKDDNNFDTLPPLIVDKFCSTDQEVNQVKRKKKCTVCRQYGHYFCTCPQLKGITKDQKKVMRQRILDSAKRLNPY